MKYDEKGRELPDPTPIAMPVGYHKPEPLIEQIRRLVKNELSRKAEADGFESFEEADDFDTGEDAELRSPYELDDRPIDDPAKPEVKTEVPPVIPPKDPTAPPVIPPGEPDK